jgi:hypothetical protein
VRNSIKVRGRSGVCSRPRNEGRGRLPFLSKWRAMAALVRDIFRNSALVAQALQHPELVTQALRDNDLVTRALRDTDLVNGALENKNLVTEVLEFAPFVRDTLRQREHLLEVMRLERFVRTTLEERYWLEGAIADKPYVMSRLDEKRGKDAACSTFWSEFEAFRTISEASGTRLPVRKDDAFPQLADRTGATPFDRHYTYHPAWAARILMRTKPAEHVDISSILAFATMISAFIPTRFYDFRPAPLDLPGLSCGSADLTALPFADRSVASLSCMHVIEHIGLGRYGDPLDADGDLKAVRELVRVLAPGGNLLVVTPVGRARVQFNAHRIYDHEEFARAFAPLELVEFALIEECGERGLIVSPDSALVRAQDYGCGCFWLRRPV